MITDALSIAAYRPGYENAVVALWEECGLTGPGNDPRRDIARKMRVNPELFLVGVIEGSIVATVMGGYDGHRGWADYLAVAPAWRRQGIGRIMMTEFEDLLRLTTGCLKIHVRINTGNEAAKDFYRRLGYEVDHVVSLGKRLTADG